MHRVHGFEDCRGKLHTTTGPLIFGALGLLQSAVQTCLPAQQAYVSHFTLQTSYFSVSENTFLTQPKKVFSNTGRHHSNTFSVSVSVSVSESEPPAQSRQLSHSNLPLTPQP